MNPSQKARNLRLGVVILFWAILYLPHLRTVPGWYGDETIAVILGKNLVHGEMAYGAVRNTFVTIVYQPLYLAAAGLGWLIFQDIIGPRLVNALLALATALVIHGIGRRIFPSTVALAAALIFLGYEQSVVHFRQCFPHNAVAFGAAVAILSVCRPATRKGSNLTAGWGVALALGAHPLGIYVAITTGVARILRPRSWIGLVLPALILLTVSYGWIITTQWTWLVEDIRALAASYSSYGKENSSSLGRNLSVFFTQDMFHLVGLIGCLLLAVSPRKIRRVAIVLFVVGLSLALFRNRSNLTVFYYQAVPLLPFLALGTAWAAQFWIVDRTLRLRAVVTALSPTFRRLLRRSIVPLVVFALTASVIGKSLSGKITPRNKPWITQNTTDVEQAAAWLNDHTDPNDVVIANSNLAWLLRARSANLLQLTAWNGRKTFMYEFGMPQERFLFPLDPANIRYVVLGDIDRGWGVHQENVLDVLRLYQIEKWPIVWQSPTYVILGNPEFPAVQGTPNR